MAGAAGFGHNLLSHISEFHIYVRYPLLHIMLTISTTLQWFCITEACFHVIQGMILFVHYSCRMTSYMFVLYSHGLECLLEYWNKIYSIIASTVREARRERSELYGREYDQGKVTYNDIYFQQKSLWSIFFPFSSRKLTGLERTWY